MSSEPFIENRSEAHRPCSCGRDHEIKIIHGMFHYSETNHVAFCVSLIEHEKDRHVWIAFITGQWPNTNQPDCYVTVDVWANSEGRGMRILDGSESPFTTEEVFDAYPLSREQVLAVDGAKDWVIQTYLSLFSTDAEIGNYLDF